MTLPAGALARWHRRQRELLDRYYLLAWQRGVESYEPDPDPTPEQQRQDHSEELAAAGALAVVVARRHRPYVKPRNPDEDRRRHVLAPAIASLNRMVGEISAVNTTPELAPGGRSRTPSEAVAQWADSNANRLMMGVGAAVWGGEQAGFAQAASADGQLLIWLCQGDEGSCPDCLEMADLPAALEVNWPTLPGGGGTQCNGNCRCTMDVAPPGYNG